MVAAGVLSVGLLLGPRIAMALDAGAAGKSGAAGDRPVYQHHFPSMRQQTNIKYHFGQSLKKQSKGFFLQLEELEKARQSVPAMEIDLLEYDAQQNTLTLSVSAQNSARVAGVC